MLPGLDLHSIYAGPAQHLIAAAIGSTVDYLYDLYDLYDLYNLYDLYDLYDSCDLYDLDDLVI